MFEDSSLTSPHVRNANHFFSPPEDALLSDIMQTEPFLNWDEVAERIPGRSPRQCRDRWLNHLAPWIKKGG
jgi:myb proto-oncogene protein